jgi:hypothetical protein
MADTTHTIGSTGVVKKLVDLGDGTYADAVVDYGGGGVQDAAVVLAAPTGSTGGLGKLAATIANTQVIYVRFDASTRPYQYVDWVTSHAQQADLVFYKAQSIVDNVTLTLASFTEDDVIILNGLSLEGDTTAAQALYSGRLFYCSGDNADALALSKLINADWSIIPDGSVAVNDTLTVTTNEDTYVFTAAAAPDYPNRVFDQAGNQAAELASLVLAINHKGYVTCVANPVVGDTVTVGGQVYTFATVENTVTHAPTRVGTADQIGISLAACINADTTAQTAHGISASNNTGVVTMTRTTPTALGLASSNVVKLAVVQPAGVPGVLAVATGGTGELSLTPTWVTSITCLDSATHIDCVDIDVPGIKAAATGASAVVTLTPGTPGAPTGQDLATVISATAAARCTVSQAATLAGLMVDLTPTAALNEALTTGTAGSLHTQAVGGYPYCYLGLTADNATPQAVSVSAIGRV